MAEPTPIQRRRAAGLAGHIGNPAAARRGITDTDPKVREAALRSLARIDDLDDAALAMALSDTSPRVRIAALELASTRTGPPIDALLNDPETAVVEAAAWACGERPANKSIVAELATLASHHDDPLVRESAVAALGALGHVAGLATVLAATHDKPAIRRRAVLALAAFDGPEVDAAWERARSDRDRQVRDAVEELLGPAVPALSDDDCHRP